MSLISGYPWIVACLFGVFVVIWGSISRRVNGILNTLFGYESLE